MVARMFPSAPFAGVEVDFLWRYPYLHFLQNLNTRTNETSNLFQHQHEPSRNERKVSRPMIITMALCSVVDALEL